MTSEPQPVGPDQLAKAARFRALHDEGTFLMPCAWDAGSAKLFEAAGFQAIGTTSGGVNWSRGRPDYVYSVSRHEMLADYGQIASAVETPVSGDLENGYGATPAEVAETVRAAIRCGMIGGSFEDQSSDPAPGLIPMQAAAARIAAARQAADGLISNFTITARAESFFGGVVDPFDDSVKRANLYVEAGADCIFVPGLSDLPSLKRLVDAVPAPISLGVGSGGGSLEVDGLRAIGVRRISTGGGLPRALYAAVVDASRQMLDGGTFGYTDHVISEDDVNALMG